MTRATDCRRQALRGRELGPFVREAYIDAHSPGNLIEALEERPEYEPAHSDEVRTRRSLKSAAKDRGATTKRKDGFVRAVLALLDEELPMLH